MWIMNKSGDEIFNTDNIVKISITTGTTADKISTAYLHVHTETNVFNIGSYRTYEEAEGILKTILDKVGNTRVYRIPKE